MVKIIETNLSIHDKTDEIMDHQSRIVEAESWEQYVDYYFNYMNGFDNFKFKCLTKMQGETLPREAQIENFKYDDFHLSCDVVKHIDYHGQPHTIITKKLAYFVE